MSQSPGKIFKQHLAEERPLQVVGAINAYSAMLAEHTGFKAVYLSGAGVANASYGLPDLGVTTLENVVEDASRITAATKLPLLVDIDTGWDDVGDTIRAMERAGVAAVHMEDQVAQKRCGHRPNKELVAKEEMGDRIKAALDAREDSDFIIMARCDALAPEGLQSAIERSAYYVECGADMIFAEAMTDINHYKLFKDAIDAPLLANITEFGKTELYSAEQLASVGVDMALYPLSAFRAMSKAALDVYGALRSEGTQKHVLDKMQTRADLYEHLGYHKFEEQQDSTRSTAGSA